MRIIQQIQQRPPFFSLIQLEIARSGFSFDISFHPAKMGSVDKAKPSVRVGRKATGIAEKDPSAFK